MSDQPQFRPRVLPMPRVGDRLLGKFRDGVFLGIVLRIDKRRSAFQVVWEDAAGAGTLWSRTNDASWCWEKTAAEALRLQEAAWRADTSPLPESLVENTKYAKDIEEVIGNIFGDCMTTCGCYERGDKVDAHKAIKAIAEAAPHLLRWQAQQEQK